MSVSTYVPDSTKILHIAYADFVSRQIGRTVHVVQYDDSLPLLAVKLFSDGQPYTIPSNANISIKLGKSDDKFVYNPALGCDSTRHIAYFEITYQMVVLAETVSPVIEVRIGSSIAASSSIGIIIDRNPIQRDDIESTSEWKVIQEALDYSKEAISAAASASASRSAAATSEQNALSYRNAAQTAATNAANSASASATSASNARTSENNAANSASNSATSAAKAKISETNAKTSESNAANSEHKAKEKASEADIYSLMSKSYAIGEGNIRENERYDNAKYYSEQAENSNNEAKESAYDSDIYSMLAKSYAVGQSTVTLGDGIDELVTDDGFSIELFGRDGEDTDNAKYYSEQAADSASSIFGVEERVSADLDEWTEKLTDLQTLAEQVSENKESVDASETNAKTYMDKALEYSNNAKTSETNAKTSETNAKASEDNIAGCEENCTLNAKAARSYAVGDTDYRTGENTDNAKYYYQQVKQISEGLGGIIPMGTISFEELTSQTKESGYMFNISDEFESDNTFKDGGGIKYPAGTNVYYTADGYWDCLAGSLISGIKGNAESEYRCGFVNITPENIGSYDKESVDNFISGLNSMIQSLSGTVNTLISRITELEDLSGFAHLVVDESGSELVTSDNHTIILSI